MLQLYQSEGSTGGIATNLRFHVESNAHKKNCVTRKAHGGGLLSMGFTVLLPLRKKRKFPTLVLRMSCWSAVATASVYSMSLNLFVTVCVMCGSLPNTRHGRDTTESFFYKSGGEIHMRRFKSSEGSVEGEYDLVTRSTLRCSSKCHRVVLKGDVPFPSL